LISRDEAERIALKVFPDMQNREWSKIEYVDSGRALCIYSNIPQLTELWLVYYSCQDRHSASNVIGACKGLAINKADGKILFHGLITDEG
jgi:hypothetical protein